MELPIRKRYTLDKIFTLFYFTRLKSESGKQPQFISIKLSHLKLSFNPLLFFLYIFFTHFSICIFLWVNTESSSVLVSIYFAIFSTFLLLKYVLICIQYLMLYTWSYVSVHIQECHSQVAQW